MGNALVMPRLSGQPGAMDRRGAGLLRGRFGTAPAAHPAGTPVLAHPFRYWDRWADRADAPELAYFGFLLEQPNAFWRTSFFQAEAPPSGLARIEVLQRVTRHPGEEVPWDAEPGQAIALTLLEPKASGREGFPLGTQADRLEWRAFVRFLPGAFDALASSSHGWKQTPRLRWIGAEYLGPDLVLRRVER
jgi:hypothetical protein